MVSLKDISVRCGVSVATVSKALNGHKDVSEATRERLMKAAKEMGYFPNSQARALKTNRTYNLGVMYLDEAGSGLTHEFFAKVLDSFKTTAEAAGYDITFINRDVGKQKMSTYEHCKYRNVDGVIIACTDFTSQDVYEVINGDIPVVTIDHIFDCRTAIMSNNEKGMEELINYVTKMGHRKIAFIQGNRSAVAERRLAGFYKACMTRGISVDPDWILNGDYHNPDLTYKLTHPKHDVDKTYIAKLYGVPDEGALQKFRRGVVIDGRKTRPAKIQILEKEKDMRFCTAEIIIHEGKNRQVRKMCEAIKHPVAQLKRVATGELTLGDLPKGKYRYLTEREIKYLKKL